MIEVSFHPPEKRMDVLMIHEPIRGTLVKENMKLYTS
jgi:hypothetical protein